MSPPLVHRQKTETEDTADPKSFGVRKYLVCVRVPHFDWGRVIVPDSPSGRHEVLPLLPTFREYSKDLGFEGRAGRRLYGELLSSCHLYLRLHRVCLLPGGLRLQVRE